jgi:hypothetical protein
MRRSKIFGIGLSKTGTTSLAEALERFAFVWNQDHMPLSLSVAKQSRRPARFLFDSAALAATLRASEKTSKDSSERKSL